LEVAWTQQHRVLSVPQVGSGVKGRHAEISSAARDATSTWRRVRFTPGHPSGAPWTSL